MSWVNKITTQDSQRGYKLCPICITKMIVLNSGTETKREAKCIDCGELHLVTVKEYFKFQKAIE